MDDTRMSHVKPSLFMIYAVGSSLLGSISLGLTVGYSSSAIPSMENNSTFRRIVEPHHEETKSWIKSIISIGAMIGALIAGPIANLIGRKLSLIIANGPFFLGWLSIGFASGISSILFGRLATGLCSGFVCTIIPLYLVEISPCNLRGLIGSTFQAAVIGGILLSSILGVFLDWRQLALISSLPCLIMPLLMFFTTESPAYLINQQSANSNNNNNNNDTLGVNNSKETYKVLQRLRSNSSDIQSELKEMGSTGSTEEEVKIFLPWSVMRKPEVYRPFLVTFGIIFFQQFSGISPVTFSMVEIFTMSQISLNSFVCSVIVNSVSFVLTIIASLLADRCGRKPLLIISGVLHVISLTILGSTFYLIDLNPSLASKYGPIALVALALFVSGFALGYGCLPFTMISEYTIYEARGLISSAGTCFCWTFAFFLVKMFDSLQHFLKPSGTYWLLALISSISVPFVVFFVPETKGKSAEQIAHQFNSNIFQDIPCTSSRK